MPVLTLRVHGAAIETYAEPSILTEVEHLFDPFVAPESPNATALHIEVGAPPDTYNTGHLRRSAVPEDL